MFQGRFETDLNNFLFFYPFDPFEAGGNRTANGQFDLTNDGSFTYTPNANFNGAEKFDFILVNLDTLVDQQITLTVTVNPVNDAPVFDRESTELVGVEDGPPIVTQLIATDPDGDQVTFRRDPDPNFRIFAPARATLTSDGLLTYDPGPNRSGIGGLGVDFVAVVADDGAGGVTNFLISPVVEQVIDPPIVEDLEITVTRGEQFIGQVDAINIEGTRLSYGISDDLVAEAGSVSIDDSGSFFYTATDPTRVSDQFELVVSTLGVEATLLVEVMIEERPTIGGGGSDNFAGDDQGNVFNGLAGDDRLFGNEGPDSLVGGRGADTIDGGNDNDELRGGAGADSISGGFGRDMIFGGAGADILRGGGGRDTLGGGAGRDQVIGGGGADALSGGAGRDTLAGGAGRDIIEGGGGRDQITGGRGADTLTGNAGADRFVFSSSDGRDTITDFQQGRDQIQIDEAIGFNQLSIAQVGDDVRIGFDTTRIIVLDDQVSNFSSADFIFG